MPNREVMHCSVSMAVMSFVFVGCLCALARVSWLRFVALLDFTRPGSSFHRPRGSVPSVRELLCGGLRPSRSREILQAVAGIQSGLD